jgi:hypothetical protein
MTWALAKICKLFALGMNLRNSLKVLKKMSSSSSSSSKEEITAIGKSFLMFWSIFALIIIWEQYFERLVAWFPLYFYAKSFFIVLMSFPRLKFTHNIFHSYLIPLFEWIHNHYEHLSEIDWKASLVAFPFHLFFLFFPFHLKVEYVSASSSSPGLDGEKENNEQEYEEEGDLIPAYEEDSYDLSIPLDDQALDDPLTAPATSTPKSSQGFDQFPEENLQTKYRPKTGPISTNPFEEKQFSSPKRASSNLAESKSEELPSSEKVSPMINSVRQVSSFFSQPLSLSLNCSFSLALQLLTGDASAKLRDSIFNFDVHSPNPNTLYRQRHSVIPSPAPVDVKTSRTRQSTSRDPSKTFQRPAPVPSVTIFREPSEGSHSTTADPTVSSPFLHKIIRSSRGSEPTNRRLREDGSKKSSTGSGNDSRRGTKTKYQIELESDDITSPLHFSPSIRGDGVRTRIVEEGKAVRGRSLGNPFNEIAASADAKHTGRVASRADVDQQKAQKSRPLSQRRGGTPTRMPTDQSDEKINSNREIDSSQVEERSRYSLRSLRRRKEEQEEEIKELTLSERPASESKRPVSIRNLNASSSLNNFKK